MQGSDLFRLGHMLDAALHIQKVSSQRTRFDIEYDDELPYALMALFQILGEAARNVSPELKREHPEIEWSKIIGMRNKLAHGYFDIDYDLMWDIVRLQIPQLITRLEPLVDQLKLGF